MVQVCSSEKKDKCRTENILIIVDQTPPIKPTIALPADLPDESEEKVTIKGVTEPSAKVVMRVDKNTTPAETYANDKGEFEVSIGLALGIDTPETVHPSKTVQCYGKEASEKNRELVEGKKVKLEKDISETDKYGRLLRYIWLGDILVNEYLAREGYAHSSTYPPDVKYQSKFMEAERQAREEKKGLWGDVCHDLEEAVQKPVQTQVVTPGQNTPPISTAPTTSGSYTCDCAKVCSKMSSCAEAQYQLNVCGCQVRDGDGDGIACDSDCQ